MHIDLPLRTKPTSKSIPESLLDSPLPHAPQYCNARDKDRRQIFPPKRYAKVDVVAYALSVINGIFAKNPFVHYHFVREAIASGEIDCTYNNPIYMMSKTLLVTKFEDCLDLD